LDRIISVTHKKMTIDEFRESLTATEPPPGISHALAGLWRDGKGDWAIGRGRTNLMLPTECARVQAEGGWVTSFLGCGKISIKE
jgi:hypothetical protein